MPKIQIYTWSNCPYCIRAKDFFKQRSLGFEEIDLDGQDEELRKLRERTGFRTVPQIFINDRFIGGYQDMVSLDTSGELAKILKG